jgi:hypothetical protein
MKLRKFGLAASALVIMALTAAPGSHDAQAAGLFGGGKKAAAHATVKRPAKGARAGLSGGTGARMANGGEGAGFRGRFAGKGAAPERMAGEGKGRAWQGKGQSWKVQGSNGGSGMFSRNASGDGAGNSSVSRRWEGGNGKNAGSTTDRSWNKETQTLSRETTGTGPNGGTWSGNTTATKTETGGTYSGSWTGPKGNTASTQGTVTKTDDGWNRTGSWTGPQGNTSTFEKTVTKTDNGFEHTQTWTGADGKTVTNTGTLTKTEGGWTNAGTVTGPNGKTGTYEDIGTKTDNGWTKSQEWTGPNGNTATRGVEVTHEEGVTTKTITQPNGETRSWTATRVKGQPETPPADAPAEEAPAAQ